MCKNAIAGYPRVGSQRELKFWTEDFFKGKLSAEKLECNSRNLRKEQWQLLQQMGIDFIPSNDFSFYDGVLDTAYLLNAIPENYQKLELNGLDTYFSMARGYQGEKGDAKALSMRKWFNTNYHYMVPVLDENTKIRLNGRKPFEQYNEALALGIETVPVIVGPFTFLKLADIRGNTCREAFIQDMAEAYVKIIQEFGSLNCKWLQLDEPSLVTDLDREDISLFTEIYTKLLGAGRTVKIKLQTYFGDIRDIYVEVVKLGFDGIGLDFIEGKKNMELVQTNGFPKATLLFAGVVNGKNIWKNNYDKTLLLLGQLEEKVEKDRIVISASCSLLHVPYTIHSESSMDYKYKQYLAFAKEKLEELSELKELYSSPVYSSNEIYLRNNLLHKSKQEFSNKSIKTKIWELKEEDFIRNPAFEVGEKLQKEKLQLPVLPTTTIGSFPQTAQVKACRASYRKKEITKEEYTVFIQQKISECIALQEEIGLDVLVHGEFERNDMVEHFGENLEGCLFTQKGWVQSYGTRCVKPPIIWNDIKRRMPITVEYSKFARSLTSKPVKGMLTGPVTILNWSFPREDVSNREMALQLALAIREEVMDLEAAGIGIIQIDEAALKEKLPLRRADWEQEYLDWAIPAFRLTHSGVSAQTQIHTHMCYSEFEDIVRYIDAMDADVISFEASRSNLSIIDALNRAGFKTEVGPGVYDIHSPRIPHRHEIVQALGRMLEKIKAEKLWVNPDCGLKTRGETETVGSLKNMVAAAKELRNILR